MKNIVVTFLLVCTTNFVSGEALHTIQKKDSLKFYQNVVNHSNSSQDLVKAFKFYDEQRKLSSTNNDTLITLYSLEQIAKIQLKFEDFYGSETTLFKALSYLDAMPSNDLVRERKIKIYTKLGSISKDRLDYELALKYFKKGLSLGNSSALKNTINNHIAEIYIKQSKFDQAEALLTELYTTRKKSEDSIKIAQTLDQLGFVEGKLNRVDALTHLNEALNIRLKLNDQLGTYTSHKHISQYYKDRKDYEQAKTFAQNALQISKEIQNPLILEDALANLILMRPNTIEYEYKILKDSIETIKRLAKNDYATMKFDYSNQEQMANQIKTQNEKDRLRDLLFQTIGIIVFIIAILIITMLHSKNQRDRLTEIYLTETRISKKLHDEVANDVYQVMAQLERDIENKDRVLDALEDIYSRTRDISKENSSIALNEKFEEVLNDLLMRYNTDSITVITRNLSKIDWENMESIKKITLYRILQELMVNMKKHSKATIVAVTFNYSGKKLKLKYSDNGIGCSLEKHSGLQNVENRIVSLNGTVIFDSRPNHGFKAEISI